MKRYDIINHFIKKRGYKSYLEIGVDNPNNCYNKIVCELKCGVDPNKGKTKAPNYFRLTSDDFFKQNKTTFDIVFIDGLHTFEQCCKDIKNALSVINLDGMIIVHDCKPPYKKVAMGERVPGLPWYGEVWRSWCYYRGTYNNISMYCIDADCGCGIIEYGKQKSLSRHIKKFCDFETNKNEILNLIKPEEMLCLT